MRGYAILSKTKKDTYLTPDLDSTGGVKVQFAKIYFSESAALSTMRRRADEEDIQCAGIITVELASFDVL